MYWRRNFPSEEKLTKSSYLFITADYPTAVKHYNEAVKRNPSDPRIYSNRAACYTKLAEFGMALADVDECLKLDDKFLKAYLRKGGICMMIKQILRAKSAYEKALEIDPSCQVITPFSYIYTAEKDHPPYWRDGFSWIGFPLDSKFLLNFYKHPLIFFCQIFGIF